MATLWPKYLSLNNSKPYETIKSLYYFPILLTNINESKSSFPGRYELQLFIHSILYKDNSNGSDSTYGDLWYKIYTKDFFGKVSISWRNVLYPIQYLIPRKYNLMCTNTISIVSMSCKYKTCTSTNAQLHNLRLSTNPFLHELVKASVSKCEYE